MSLREGSLALETFRKGDDARLAETRVYSRDLTPIAGARAESTAPAGHDLAASLAALLAVRAPIRTSDDEIQRCDGSATPTPADLPMTLSEAPVPFSIRLSCAILVGSQKSRVPGVRFRSPERPQSLDSMLAQNLRFTRHRAPSGTWSSARSRTSSSSGRWSFLSRLTAELSQRWSRCFAQARRGALSRSIQCVLTCRQYTYAYQSASR